MSSSSVGVTLGAGFVQDLTGNPSVATTLACSAAHFVTDNVAPQLVGAVLDMNNSALVLDFDEPINSWSLDTSKVQIGSSSAAAAVAVAAASAPATTVAIEVLAGSGVVVPLSASSVVRLAHPTQRVTVVVDKAALDALKASDAIAMGTSTSFVGLAAGAFADTFDNGVAAVRYEADSVVEDETAPRLLRFGLDLDKAQLYLVFNEPVRTGSWDGSNVQLQSTSARGNHTGT